MSSVITVRAIKPKQFNDAAFMRRLEMAARQASKMFKSDFELTTKTWEHDVKFEKETRVLPSALESEAWTVDQIYIWVSDGTEGPYPIYAGIYTGKSDKTVLAFSSDFVPKTSPGIISAGPGRRGPVDTFVPHVMHPGIEARKFDESIRKLREPWYVKLMNRALSDAAKASGHACR